MRQAGRILKEYRAIRSQQKSFKALVKNNELAAEVTMQPVDILGVDAAIIFSDILVIPEAMGCNYEIVEKVGPIFERPVRSAADIEKLISGEDAAQQLDYVYNSLKIVSNGLADDKALIGFAGAPWTIFAYMIEGKGSKNFAQPKAFLMQHNDLSHKLLQKITSSTIAYLKGQIKAGAEVLQIFDSWAGYLSPEMFRTYALPYIRQIVDAIDEVPVIVFAKGAWYALEDLDKLNCEAISLDWTITPSFAREHIKNKVLQGNMDPSILLGSEEIITSTTLTMMEQFGSQYIVNLGHGLLPNTPVERVKQYVDLAKSYRYSS
ncbi:UNVERIFIED_CONTAM: hypothetical protein GTU68_010840 [Idotea baltica]|nr:hypothetical protein [Idotea baltica]